MGNNFDRHLVEDTPVLGSQVVDWTFSFTALQVWNPSNAVFDKNSV